MDGMGLRILLFIFFVKLFSLVGEDSIYKMVKQMSLYLRYVELVPRVNAAVKGHLHLFKPHHCKDFEVNVLAEIPLGDSFFQRPDDILADILLLEV